VDEEVLEEEGEAQDRVSEGHPFANAPRADIQSHMLAEHHALL
jgi:hypothetical protein